MSNITGNKGLYNKFISLDEDWTKNIVNSYVLIVLISYFATKILYSSAYKIYSYESLEKEVLSFGILMILTGIIFLSCKIGNRSVLGNKDGANWLFFFGLILGINLPMIYYETTLKDSNGDKDNHYLLYTLVIIIVLLSVGLTFISTEKKIQYALYSFVLLIISISTIMARINKHPNKEAFTVDIYTTNNTNYDKTLKEDINQNESEINRLRDQISNMQKNNNQTYNKLSDLEYNHNQLLEKHESVTSTVDENTCTQNKISGDFSNYYIAAGAFAISLLLTTDSKDPTINGFISILQGFLLGSVISGIGVGVFKNNINCKKSRSGSGGSGGGGSGGGGSGGGGSSECKPYTYKLNDTANTILYITASFLIIISFGTSFYFGKGKGAIWSLGLFFITLPLIALILYVMVIGAREKIINPHCTKYVPSGKPNNKGKNTLCLKKKTTTPFLDSISFTSDDNDSSDDKLCSCKEIKNCKTKKSIIKNEKYNPVYLILLVALSIFSISGGIHEVIKGNFISMIIFLAFIPIILSIIFLPLFFKDLNKKLIFNFNLKDIYTKCCKSKKTDCVSYMNMSNSKSYGIFISLSIILLLIGGYSYTNMQNYILSIITISLSLIFILTIIILKTVMKMNNFNFGLDPYIGLSNLIIFKKESDINNSDISSINGMQNAEKKITGEDFIINDKYIFDIQNNIKTGYNVSLCAVFNQSNVITMPKNVCKILYYSNKRAKACPIINYNHTGCGLFGSCTYSGKSKVLGKGTNSIQLEDGFIKIYTCTRNTWKTGAGILFIVLILFIIMFSISYFINKKESRVIAN